MIFQIRGEADRLLPVSAARFDALLPAATRHLPAFASRTGTLALMLALAACGGGGSNSNSSGTAALSTAASSGAAPAATAGASLDSATVKCWGPDGPDSVAVQPKTITINNNSDTTIYPVLATGSNPVNQWLQGCFHSTQDYQTKFVNKLYVNEGKGIAKNSSVTITLPLYSQLSTGDYITWWNGGRVVLADKNDRLIVDADKKLTESPRGVSCQGSNTECNLSLYSNNVQFVDDVYAQLTEYTFGDFIAGAGQAAGRLKTDNVGYNISYVDQVYMPVAITPKGNPYIGYIGSADTIANFRSVLQTFLDSPAGDGWPVYNMGQLKLPSMYVSIAGNTGYLTNKDAPVEPGDGSNPPVLTVQTCIRGGCTPDQRKNLHYGPAFQRVMDLWGSCVDWSGYDWDGYTPGPSIQCPQKLKTDLTVVKQFFEQSHADYIKLRRAQPATCDLKIPEKPLTFMTVLTHIYGWVPFNEGCSAEKNPLSGTVIPGWTHATIQPMYIHDLQYNYLDPSSGGNSDPQLASSLTFNPYNKLIHDKLHLTAYGFSVDDAVGFMSELGDGLVFSVGGTAGLGNEQAFNYRDGFSVQIGVPKYLETSEFTPLIKKYGVCAFNKDANDPSCAKDKQDITMPAHSLIAGFRVGTVPSYPIRVRFTDLNDNEYAFVIKEKFAVCGDGSSCPSAPPNRGVLTANFDCSVVTKAGVEHSGSKAWCNTFNPNQAGTELKSAQTVKNTASFNIPVDQTNDGPRVSP